MYRWIMIKFWYKVMLREGGHDLYWLLLDMNYTLVLFFACSLHSFLFLFDSQSFQDSSFFNIYFICRPTVFTFWCSIHPYTFSTDLGIRKTLQNKWVYLIILTKQILHFLNLEKNYFITKCNSGAGCNVTIIKANR